MFIMEQLFDLIYIVGIEVKFNIFVLMCFVFGYDVSGYVEDFVVEQNMQIILIVIGFVEGFN